MIVLSANLVIQVENNGEKKNSRITTNVSQEFSSREEAAQCVNNLMRTIERLVNSPVPLQLLTSPPTRVVSDTVSLADILRAVGDKIPPSEPDMTEPHPDDREEIKIDEEAFLRPEKGIINEAPTPPNEPTGNSSDMLQGRRAVGDVRRQRK